MKGLSCNEIKSCYDQDDFVAIQLQLLLTPLEPFGTLAARISLAIISMIRTRPSLISRCNISLALALGLVLLTSIPFVQALEIHHLFAEVDHDGHQHSDYDLCQWIQHHSGNSLIWDAPRVSHWSAVTGFLFFDLEEVYGSLTLPLCHPRGPPDSISS